MDPKKRVSSLKQYPVLAAFTLFFAALFEHPSQVTASEEQPGRYWKNYKEK